MFSTFLTLNDTKSITRILRHGKAGNCQEKRQSFPTLGVSDTGETAANETNETPEREGHRKPTNQVNADCDTPGSLTVGGTTVVILEQTTRATSPGKWHVSWGLRTRERQPHRDSVSRRGQDNRLGVAGGGPAEGSVVRPHASLGIWLKGYFFLKERVHIQ